jgi:hypothetical protein
VPKGKPKPKTRVLLDTPELIPESTNLQKATPTSLPRLQKRIFLENAEGMLVETFKAMRAKIRRGDMAAIKLSAEMHNFVSSGKGGGSVTIFNKNQNIANAEAAAVASANSETLDDMIRRLDEREHKISTHQDFVDVTAE